MLLDKVKVIFQWFLGFGATALKQQLLNDKDMSFSASNSSWSNSKTETSTPVCVPSRGRTRTRNSGQSSLSSPIRRQNPPDKRVKVDGGQEISQGQGQGDDILDPGDESKDK